MDFEMPIKIRISAFVIAAILGMGWFAGEKLGRDLDRAATLESFASIASVNDEIGAFVTELQRERGTSAGFIGAGGGNAFAQRLLERRAATKTARARFEAELGKLDRTVLGDDFLAAVATIGERLGALEAMRARVDALDVPVGEQVAFYTGIVEPLISLVSLGVNVDAGSVSNRKLTALHALLLAKEKAGLERAMGANGFAADTFAPAVLKNFVRLAAQQESLIGIFRHYATRKSVAELDSIIENPVFAAIDDLRTRATEGRDEGVEAGHWFDLSTQRIDALGALEESVYAELHELSLAASAQARSRATINIAMLIGFMMVFMVGGIAIVWSITRPLSMLSSSLKRISQGQFDQALPYTANRDELGEIARAAEGLRAGLHKAEADRETALRDLANDIETQMREAVGEIASIGSAMANSAQSMTTVAGFVSDKANEVTEAAQETLSTSQMVAAAVEELAASSREIGSQASQTTIVVRQVSQAGERTRETFASLVTAASRIGDVTKLISEIAAKTSLLALNATIESARAGEAGKGFAVVANEVKALAAQTAKATDDIGSQITEIQQATNAAAAALDGIGREIDTMDQVATSVAAAVEEQVVATEEISRNVAQTATASNTVNDRIGLVSREAGEAKRHAGVVGSGAQRMVASIETLQTALVRAVRTSCSAVERRISQRLTIEIEATAIIDGSPTPAHLVDISEGGAQMRLASGLPESNRGILKFPMFRKDLRFDIVDRTGDRIHVRFDLDDATRDALKESLASLGLPAAA